MSPRVLRPTENIETIRSAWKILRYGRAFRLHKPVKSAKIATDLSEGSAWLEVDDADFDRSVALLEAAGLL